MYRSAIPALISSAKRSALQPADMHFNLHSWQLRGREVDCIHRSVAGGETSGTRNRGSNVPDRSLRVASKITPDSLIKLFISSASSARPPPTLASSLSANSPGFPAYAISGSRLFEPNRSPTAAAMHRHLCFLSRGFKVIWEGNERPGTEHLEIKVRFKIIRELQSRKTKMAYSGSFVRCKYVKSIISSRRRSNFLVSNQWNSNNLKLKCGSITQLIHWNFSVLLFYLSF